MSRRGRARGVGYATINDPDKRLVEIETVCCAHCQAILMKHDPTSGKRTDVELAGFCMRCSANVCGPCADHGTCTPFLAVVDKMEREGRQRAALFDALSDR